MLTVDIIDYLTQNCISAYCLPSMGISENLSLYLSIDLIILVNDCFSEEIQLNVIALHPTKTDYSG